MDTRNLVVTKLSPPRSQVEPVKRKSALQVLNSMQGCKLSLIHAPAGYGKTTLMKQWRKVLIDEGSRECWLSLDKADNSPSTFLRYLISAIRTLEPSFANSTLYMLNSTIELDISLTLANIVNELGDLPSPVWVFLDDYHVIDNKDIHRFMELLLNLAPIQLKIVIATRSLPMFALSPLRVSNNICEVTEETLRFDLNECKAYIDLSTSSPITADQLEVLFQRTEGWAAGLQLAIYSQSKFFDTNTFIDTLSGRTTDIAEYLAHSVLRDLDEKHRDFLLRTSVLERFNVDSSNAVLSQSNSHTIIRKLVESNLFILALDNEEKWYRYHHLFQQFLQNELHRHKPGLETQLLRRASLWCADQGDMQSAVDYALRATDMVLAVKLIEERAAIELSEGNMPKVCEWINKIPTHVRSKHPKVLLQLGTALAHVNQSVSARKVLDELKASLDKNNAETANNEASGNEWDVELIILDAVIRMAADQTKAVTELLRDVPHSSNFFSEGMLNNIMAYAYAVNGELQLAEKYHALAFKAHQSGGSEFGLIYARILKSMTHYLRGDIVQGLTLIESHEPADFRNPQKHLYITPTVDFNRGLFYYEMNQVDKAKDLIMSNIDIIGNCGHIHSLQLGYSILSRLHVRAGEYQQAFNLLNKLSKLQNCIPEDTYHALFVASCKVKLFLKTDQRNEALKEAMLQNIPREQQWTSTPTEWDRNIFLRFYIQTQLLVATQQLEYAHTVLKPLYDWTSTCHQGYRAIDVLILKSSVEDKLGEFDAADDSLKTAIVLAAPSDMFSIFLESIYDICPVLTRLAKDTDDHSVAARFVIDLLGYFHKPIAEHKNGGADEQKISLALLEPLSKREGEILTLLARGESNGAIGEALFISLDTVKWHNRNIFSKLNAKNRTEAVIRAQELKLISM